MTRGRALSDYRDLLSGGRGRLLAGGGLLGRTGFVGVYLCVLLFAQEEYGGFADAGFVSACFSAGVAIGRVVQARLAEAFSPRLVLQLSSPAFLAALGAMIAAGLNREPLWVVMLAAAVSGLLAPAVPPIARVLWSTIGSPEQRSKYHGLEQFITELSYMLGSLLAGLLIAFFSGGLACIVVGALYAIGALLMSLSATRPVRMETLRGSYPQFLRRLLPLAAMFVLGGLGGGSVELAIPAFAIDRGEEILVGVILFVWGAGSVVGGVVLAGRIRNAQLVRWLIIGSFGLSLTIVPAALAQSSMALMLIIFLHGLLVVPLWGSAFALSEALMGSARRSQMFALLYLASTLGTSIGTAISGLLVTVLSPAASFLFGAVMYASLGVGLILRRRRILGRLQAPLSQ